MELPSPSFFRDIDGERLDLALAVWDEDAEAPYPCTVMREFRCKCGAIRIASEYVFDMYDGPFFDSLNYNCPTPDCRTYYKKIWKVPEEDKLRSGFIPDLPVDVHNRRYMPAGAPVFQGLNGRNEVKVQVRKVCEKGTVEHALFGNWSDFDVTRGADVEHLRHHAKSVIAWLVHYHTYYNMSNWELQVSVKQVGGGTENAGSQKIR